MTGSDDRVNFPDWAREVAALIPGARYEEIADAGHMVYREKPEEFTAILQDFLRK